jgi:Tfp pilus assembly PilM family ATPase
MKKERDNAEYLKIEEEFVQDYVRQVLVSFDYISSAMPGYLEVDEFIVVGGVATIPNFLSKLEGAIKNDEQTSIKTAPYIARPLEKMEKSSKINQEKFHQDESKLFLVTSLALRQFLRNY